jgi:small-conductance mechanosensitive channel
MTKSAHPQSLVPVRCDGGSRRRVNPASARNDAAPEEHDGQRPHGVVIVVFVVFGVLCTAALLALTSLVVLWQSIFGEHTNDVVFVVWAAVGLTVALTGIIVSALGAGGNHSKPRRGSG